MADNNNICIPCNVPAKVPKKYKKCIHDKMKSRCRECEGSSFCIHSRRKSRCKDCNGSEICSHGKVKSSCKDCKGTSICIHYKQKSQCKECNGASICEHDKVRSRCKDCHGNSICQHNNLRVRCIECDGSQICIHKNSKYRCKECKGFSICIHNKRKEKCKICDGRELCKSSWCETYKNKRYEGYCLPCFVNNPENIDKPVFRNYKTKENEVVYRIKETFSGFTWITDKKIQDGCSKRRPDLLLDLGTHIVIVEVDENKHTKYECSCENKRLMEISQDLGHRPVIFIRFNPDGYTDENGIKIKSCWKLSKLGIMTISNKKDWNKRIETLKQQIQYWIDNSTEKTVEIIELFY